MFTIEKGTARYVTIHERALPDTLEQKRSVGKQKNAGGVSYLVLGMGVKSRCMDRPSDLGACSTLAISLTNSVTRCNRS